MIRKKGAINLKKLWRLVALGVVGVPIVWYWWVGWRYGRAIFPVEEVRPERVAIVFGARIYPDGRLSSMLRDRVETAVELYETGKVEKILLSGDNRYVDYDEPGRMIDYAIARGIPAEDLQPDYGGRRTYDTCYRAREIFGLERAVLVSQAFHLPRAIFTCRQLGIDAVGVAADRQPYSRRSLAWSRMREMPALVVAFIDVLKRSPPPVLGDHIPIN